MWMQRNPLGLSAGMVAEGLYPNLNLFWHGAMPNGSVNRLLSPAGRLVSSVNPRGKLEDDQRWGSHHRKRLCTLPEPPPSSYHFLECLTGLPRAVSVGTSRQPPRTVLSMRPERVSPCCQISAWERLEAVGGGWSTEASLAGSSRATKIELHLTW